MFSRIKRTLAEDCRGLLHCYWQYLLLFFAALLLDAVSTTDFMRHHGTSGEIHPLVRLYSEGLGPLLGPLAGACFKAAAGILAALYFAKFARLIFSIVAATAFLAACYNLWASELYIAGILPFLPF